MTAMLDNEEERRENERITQAAAYSLKIIFISENPNMLGKSLYGSTIDISASGLGLALDNPLPKGSTIDVIVTLQGSAKQYFLSGKVRWCRENKEDKLHHVGLVLQDLTNTDTDYKAWREALKD